MNDEVQIHAYLNSFEKFRSVCDEMGYPETMNTMLWLGYVITRKGVIA
jgi:hypothetical protein